MITEHSLLAYREIEPEINDKQLVVFKALANAERPLNNRQLAELLGWSINRVTPRVLELRELGFVEEAIAAIDPVTRRKPSFWTVKERGE